MAKSKQIAKLLKADISMTSDLAEIAKMLEKKGRGGDTILAHITRREAEMLKEMGGAGTVNPETGLLEFYDGDYSEFAPTETQYGAFGEAPAAAPVADGSSVTAEAPAAIPDYSQFAPTQTQYGAFGEAPIPSAGFAGEVPQIGQQPSAPYAVTAPKPTFLDRLSDKFSLDKLSTDQLVRLGLAGAGSLYGAAQARKGARQAEALKAEQQALAAPYQAQGREMVRAAQAGELTPTGQQAMQAFQARLAQGVEARGGVGAAQASAQAEAFRQQMLQQQYDYGLKVSSIGDQIALGAIRTGMQADQALQQASGNFYTQLASIAAGIPMGQTQQTPRA